MSSEPVGGEKNNHPLGAREGGFPVDWDIEFMSLVLFLAPNGTLGQLLFDNRIWSLV
jgi:hypothetical protein